MSFCPNCGSEMFESEKFCSRCGSRPINRERRQIDPLLPSKDVELARLKSDTQKESLRELHDMAILNNVGGDVVMREAKYRGIKNLDESTKANIAPVFNIGDKDFSTRYCPVCDKRITESNEIEMCTHCSLKFCESCAAKAKSWAERVGLDRIPVEMLDEYDEPMCKGCWKELRVIVEKLGRFREYSNRDRKVGVDVGVTPQIPREMTNSAGTFKLIHAGKFLMGGETGYSDSRNVHPVAITEPFYIGVHQVTQEVWRAIMEDNPSRFKGDHLPVDNVSWYDCQNFIKRLNRKERTYRYRLPSEAEWEYAARGGSTGTYCFGNDVSLLNQFAWYCQNSGNRSPKKGSYLGYDKDDWAKNRWGGGTHVAGTKRPNKWGLHDMHGNVWEWCEDRWHTDYEGAPYDGRPWITGGDSRRVLRGGSWDDLAYHCASAYRFRLEPGFRPLNLGFRLVRSI